MCLIPVLLTHLFLSNLKVYWKNKKASGWTLEYAKLLFMLGDWFCVPYCDHSFFFSFLCSFVCLIFRVENWSLPMNLLLVIHLVEYSLTETLKFWKILHIGLLCETHISWLLWWFWDLGERTALHDCRPLDCLCKFKILKVKECGICPIHVYIGFVISSLCTFFAMLWWKFLLPL